MLQQKKWQRQSVKFQNNLSVYVAGLPPQTSYWDLRNALSQFGEVCATFVSTFKPRQTHKYGFGCFKLRSSVEKAVQSELTIHGAIVTIRRRTKSNWKQRDLAAASPYCDDSDASSSVRRAPNAMNAEFSAASSTVNYPQVAHHVHHMNSLGPVSPFVHPPEFTDYVHDTIASQYRTKGQLQAALQPRISIRNGQHDDGACQGSSTDADLDGKVVRADGVPAAWEAEDLFNFLLEHGLPLTSVLVYDDIDERGLRQALIQLESSQAADSLCDFGVLHALQVHLRFATSCIKSIGPVRRTYAGNFTAYSGMQASEAYGYSVAEPHEPSINGSITSAAPDMPLSLWPTNRAYLSPVSERHSLSSNESRFQECRSPLNEAETPDTVVGPDSPLGKLSGGQLSDGIESDHASESDVEDVSAEPQCATSFFMTRKDGTTELINNSMGQLTQLQFSKRGAAKQQSMQCRNAPFYGPPQVPMIFPKPSQTVIVDNFDSRLVGDRENLCTWVSQFGEVQILDLVPLDEHRTRAYISYMSPLDAQYTMHHLQLCMSGPYRLTVRLA